MKRLVSFALLGMIFLLSAGCAGGCGASSDKVDLVDLNKVLEIFEKTLSEPDNTPNTPLPAAKTTSPSTTPTTAANRPNLPGGPVPGAPVPGAPISSGPIPGAPASATPGTGASARPGDPTNTVAKTTPTANSNTPQPVADNATKTATFLKKFSDNLNRDIKLESTHPIGVHMMANGAVEGFIDVNKNNIKDGPDEKHLFRIEIDAQRNRLVATDESNPTDVHRRDRPYTYRPSGFFMGYMMGNMLGRQNHFYSTPGNTRPNFSSMKMSSPTYHSSAVSKARTTARASSSARGSRGGSFRGGGK